jgi:hypothetical protein
MYFQDAPYDELCGCVTVAITDKEAKRLTRTSCEFNKGFLRSLFNNTNRNRTYMADCPDCDCGISNNKEWIGEASFSM